MDTLSGADGKTKSDRLRPRPAASAMGATEDHGANLTEIILIKETDLRLKEVPGDQQNSPESTVPIGKAWRLLCPDRIFLAKDTDKYRKME